MTKFSWSLERDVVGVWMLLYSCLLALGLVLSAPWWGVRMLRGRYRAGLGQRLTLVPPVPGAAADGQRLVWVHAVSVGEVLAVERLVCELAEALGPAWRVVVSTTTETGQRIAAERFGRERVFFFPLDFATAVRRTLDTLRPELLVLVESELWPRLLHECRRRGIPVAVSNARVSDRSFRRTAWVAPLWRRMAQNVTLWLPQSEETAARLRALGVDTQRIAPAANLKYDPRPPQPSATGQRIAALVGGPPGHPVVVAGSTLPGEEAMLLDAWAEVVREQPDAVLILAPRHPARFKEVANLAGERGAPATRASELRDPPGSTPLPGGTVVLLDTLGDLAGVYALAHAAFVGGSLVPKGGHNPLEPARFAVPVLMGPHYENFREIVDGMRAAQAIRIVRHNPGTALLETLDSGRAMGERGQQFFTAQSGATAFTVSALRELLRA